MLAFVLNAGHWQLGVSAFTMHDQLMPPLVPLPAIPGMFEGATMGWPVAPFLHKKASTVLVDGNPGIQQGHDIGYGIPHLAAPLNALCLLHTGLSKHKVLFPVSSVLLKGKPVGTYAFVVLGGLICANPISLPTGVLVRIKGTVETSATLGDIIKGLAYVGLEVAFDLIWKRFKGEVPTFFKGPLSKGVGAFLGPLEGTALGDVLLYGARWQIMRTEVLNKLAQHIMKSWLGSSWFNGIFRGNPTVGRGSANYKPFEQNWW